MNKYARMYFTNILTFIRITIVVFGLRHTDEMKIDISVQNLTLVNYHLHSYCFVVITLQTVAKRTRAYQ